MSFYDSTSTSTRKSDPWRATRWVISKVARISVLLVALSVVITIGFSICAFMLIPQAIENGQLAGQASQVPPKMRGPHEAIARSSLMLGITSLMGILLNLAAIVYCVRQQRIYSVLLIAISIAAFAIIAVTFSPF